MRTRERERVCVCVSVCVCVCVCSRNALREEFDLNYFFSEMLESLLLFMPRGQFVEYFIQCREEKNKSRNIDENIYFYCCCFEIKRKLTCCEKAIKFVSHPKSQIINNFF